jgi:hypothetical protein
MTMPAKTLSALKKSIKLWQKKDVTEHHNENCPLCLLFYDDECAKCPVSTKTGKSYCVDSPFISWGRAYNNAERESARKKEVAFLKSLLPKKWFPLHPRNGKGIIFSMLQVRKQFPTPPDDQARATTSQGVSRCSRHRAWSLGRAGLAERHGGWLWPSLTPKNFKILDGKKSVLRLWKGKILDAKIATTLIPEEKRRTVRYMFTIAGMSAV